jgi:transcription antitermination factor NusG
LFKIHSSLNWFALRVRPRCERLVADALRGKGYEEFLPLHQERHHWSDRIAIVQVPLFAGYVFCRFDVHLRLPILTTPGVQLVVSAGQTPQPIDDKEIASLRILAASRLELHPWPFLHVGQRVQIVGGPLAGAEGIVFCMKNQHRLVVSVTMLQRSVAVEIPESCAWPVTSQMGLGAGRGTPIGPVRVSSERGARGGQRNV